MVRYICHHFYRIISRKIGMVAGGGRWLFIYLPPIFPHYTVENWVWWQVVDKNRYYANKIINKVCSVINYLFL
ncbi:MAG: hypothetical protein FWC97_07620 [Treponema sp.]|nr:hypothetical protein [Treponema sp.]